MATAIRALTSLVLSIPVKKNAIGVVTYATWMAFFVGKDKI